MSELALKLKVTDFSSVVVYWLMGSGQQVKNLKYYFKITPQEV